MALRLFKEMSRNVPAYKLFLKENNVSPGAIKTINDFKSLVPPIDKDNYLRKYSHKQLSWGGDYPAGSWNIATTSGSSGTPFYFPRQSSQDEVYAKMAETYLLQNFKIHERKTLYIVAFPMGAWIGGVFTYEALQRVAKRGKYNLSIITPGISIRSILDAYKELAHDFDQVIIGAYAPFLKDILDTGLREGVDWRNPKLGFVFSAEAFSEHFRDYAAKTVGAADIYNFSLNHYGTVDMGTMAHETPASVMLRRMLYERGIADLLLPDNRRQPTICQYNPEDFFFEAQGNNLLCSAYSGIPLVRYNLKDYGGVFQFNEVEQALRSKDIDYVGLLKKHELPAWRNMPFVYVYERNDFSVSYYAFLVYPDTIRRGIFENGLHNTDLTGKFSMESVYDKQGRQRLNIHVELREGKTKVKKLEAKLTTLFHQALLNESSEYTETFKMIGVSAKPVIKLHVFGTEPYFKTGAKQKWIIK